MAGAGYKLFNTGDVLTAAQVNTYLQEQAVMRFANATARTTALSGVLAEGMVSYLDDTNKVQVYNGSSWVDVGGSSPLTTKGDIYTYGTSDTRLAVGANGTILMADSGETTGLKWTTTPNFIGVAAYLQGATVSFTQNVISIISFTSEEYDTDGFHSTSSNQSRITIPTGKAGKYRFEFTFWAAEAQGNNYVSFWLYKNGSSYDANGLAARWVKLYPAANTGAFTGSVVLNCAVGDYFELGFAGDWTTGNKTITSRWHAEYLGA